MEEDDFETDGNSDDDDDDNGDRKLPKRGVTGDKVREGKHLTMHSAISQSLRSFYHAGRQHESNLTSMIREAVLRHDFRQLPAMAAAMISIQDHDRVGEDSNIDPGTPHLQRILGTLEALWVWIQRNPKNWSDLAQRQVLRTRYSLLRTFAEKEALAVEIAIFAALQGDHQRAYDFLQTVSSSRIDLVGSMHRSLYAGYLKHNEWFQGMEQAFNVVKQRRQNATASQQYGALSGRKRRFDESQEDGRNERTDAVWSCFESQPDLQRNLSSGASSASTAAEKQLLASRCALEWILAMQAALRQSPGEIQASYLLFQLHASSGRAAQAVEVADAAANAGFKPEEPGPSGEAATQQLSADPDAVALQLMALEASTRHASLSTECLSSPVTASQGFVSQLSQPSQPSPASQRTQGTMGGMGVTALQQEVHIESATENAATRMAGYLALLRSDPGSGEALRGLLSAHSTPRSVTPPWLLAEGLALHLDMCHPDSALPAEAMAWHALASLLHRTVMAALKALQRYKKPPSARKRSKMEPGVLAEVEAAEDALIALSETTLRLETRQTWWPTFHFDVDTLPQHLPRISPDGALSRAVLALCNKAVCAVFTGGSDSFIAEAAALVSDSQRRKSELAIKKEFAADGVSDDTMEESPTSPPSEISSDEDMHVGGSKREQDGRLDPPMTVEAALQLHAQLDTLMPRYDLWRVVLAERCRKVNHQLYGDDAGAHTDPVPNAADAVADADADTVADADPADPAAETVIPDPSISGAGMAVDCDEISVGRGGLSGDATRAAAGVVQGRSDGAEAALDAGALERAANVEKSRTKRAHIRGVTANMGNVPMHSAWWQNFPPLLRNVALEAAEVDANPAPMVSEQDL